MTARMMNAEFDRFVEAGVMALLSARDVNERPLKVKVDPHDLAHRLLAVLQDVAGVEFTEFGSVDLNRMEELAEIAGIAA